MLIKGEAEPDFNDLSTVKNRLNEQSKLIMLLKESCDREIMQSKEQETRYAELEDKNFELQQEIEELRQKLLNSQARVADLSGEISRTFEAIRLKKPSGKDAGTQCHADKAKRMKESGTNTEYQWLYDQKEHAQLKQTYKEISEKAQHIYERHRELEAQLEERERNHSVSIAILEDTITKLQSERDNERLQVEKLENQMHDALLSWSKERDLMQQEILRGTVYQKELKDTANRLQHSSDLLKQQLDELTTIRRKEQDELRDNLHIRRLQERLGMTEQMKYRLQQEFEAYKRHAKELLDTEKEINRALRRAFH